MRGIECAISCLPPAKGFDISGVAIDQRISPHSPRNPGEQAPSLDTSSGQTLEGFQEFLIRIFRLWIKSKSPADI
jgi:hypothetical protein